MKYCDEFAPLLSAFVDGELDAAQREAVLAHAAVCESCRVYLGELTEMRAAFDAMEEADVPAGFTEGVMSAVRAEKTATRPQMKRRGFRRYFPLAACAAVVILAAAALPSLTARKAADDTAAPENTSSAPYSASTDAETAADPSKELFSEEHYAQVQGSSYDAADEPVEGDVTTDGYAKSGGSGSAAVYAMNAAIGESGEEGMLLVEDGQAPLIAIFGIGATDYLLKNGAVASEGDFYYAPIDALRDLPDSFALSEGASTLIDAAPEETEWVVLACLEESPEEEPQP